MEIQVFLFEKCIICKPQLGIALVKTLAFWDWIQMGCCDSFCEFCSQPAFFKVNTSLRSCF